MHTERLQTTQGRLSQALRQEGLDPSAALLDSGAPGVGALLQTTLAAAYIEAERGLGEILRRLTVAYPEGCGADGGTEEYRALYGEREMLDGRVERLGGLQRAARWYVRALETSLRVGAEGVEAGRTITEALDAADAALAGLVRESEI